MLSARQLIVRKASLPMRRQRHDAAVDEGLDRAALRLVERAEIFVRPLGHRLAGAAAGEGVVAVRGGADDHRHVDCIGVATPVAVVADRAAAQHPTERRFAVALLRVDQRVGINCGVSGGRP